MNSSVSFSDSLLLDLNDSLYSNLLDPGNYHTQLPSTKMPSLPPQVLDLIVDAVGQDCRYQDRLEYLGSCALVSRRFSQRSHHHMFAEVLITDMEWRMSEEDGAPVIERIHGLRDLLCATQPSWDDLASHIRSLKIRLNNEGEVERNEAYEGSDDEDSDTDSLNAIPAYHNDAVVLSDGSLAAIIDRLSCETQKNVPRAFSLTVTRLDDLEWTSLKPEFRNSIQRLVRSPSLHSFGLGGFTGLPSDFFLPSHVKSLNIHNLLSDDGVSKNDGKEGLSRLDALTVRSAGPIKGFIPDANLRGIKIFNYISPDISLSNLSLERLSSVTKLELNVLPPIASFLRPLDFGSGRLPNLEVLRLAPFAPIVAKDDRGIVDGLTLYLNMAKTVPSLNEVQLKFEVAGGFYIGSGLLQRSRGWPKLDGTLSSKELAHVKRVTIEFRYLSLRQGPYMSSEEFKEDIVPLARMAFPSLFKSNSKVFSIEIYSAGYSVPWCTISPY